MVPGTCCCCWIARARLSYRPLAVHFRNGTKDGSVRNQWRPITLRCAGRCALMPLDFQQVRRTLQEPLFNSLMEQYRCLRYERPVGEHLKYLASFNEQAIACLAWSSAVRHPASRDRFIGRRPMVANAIYIYWLEMRYGDQPCISEISGLVNLETGRRRVPRRGRKVSKSSRRSRTLKWPL